MIIDEKVKSRLLTWNEDEPVYKQFEKKCAALSKLSNLIINPSDYELQYDLHVSSIDTYIELQTELYAMLYEKYSTDESKLRLEFSIGGRLKSPFSHYEKVIRKYIELFEKEEFKVVEILDDYGINILTRSINYPVTKVSVDSEGIYIDSNEYEFRITDSDAFDFNHNGRILNVTVENSQTNIWISNGVPYISTRLNNQEIILPLKDAITYKRSNREDLIEYCHEVQKDTVAFLNSKGFVTRKRKNYISHPKESGYQARQCSFYSDELGLGIECQIKTQDMEERNKKERTEENGYKPSEKEVNANSLNKVSRFTLTTKLKDEGYKTYCMSHSECFEYIFDMTLQDYRKKMKPTLEAKPEKKTDNKETTR